MATFDSDVIVEVAFADRTYMEITQDGHATTPDSAALSITGDIDIRFFGAAESWASGSIQEMVQKIDNSTGDPSFVFQLTTGGFPILFISEDGSTFPAGTPASSVPVDAADGEELGVRATWRQSDGRTQFFTSRDNGDTWTQLGTDQTNSVTSIFDSAAPVDIGGESVRERSFLGRIYRAEIRDGIDGTVVASPDFTDSGQGWVVGDDAGDTGTDDQSNVWTLQGDAEVNDAVRPFDLFPVWTDVGEFCPRLDTRRGKSALEGHFDAGTATITFENLDGRFTPTNTAGPYYPNIKVGNQVRVRAVHAASSTDVTLFRGFTESWPLQYPDHGGYAIVRVPLVDAFKLLNELSLIGLSFPAQSTSDRVHAVLDLALFPYALRDIEEGVADLPAVTFEEATSALDHLREVEFAEVGKFFIAADGSAAFTNRTHHSAAASTATFGPDDINFTDIALTFDDDYLWNRAQLTRLGGTEQTAADQSSIDAHGKRVFDRQELHLLNDPHALNVAEWLVDLYSTQEVKVRSLTFDPYDDSSWEQVLNRDIPDFVTVKFTPPGGDAFNQAVAIYGVSHEVTVDKWFTVWHLAPLTDLQTESFWILGTSDDLDTDTILA